MSERPKMPDARALIEADLAKSAGRKRRHFAPAAVLVIAVVGLTVFAMGPRPDFLDQPGWQLGIQFATWAVCLIAFPAIGVGLWFPSRRTRIVLGAVGSLLAALAALGWPWVAKTSALGDGGGPCIYLVVGTALLVFCIGAASGAFAQRRSHTSVFWIAAGVGLCSLAAITWVCPSDCAVHIASRHVGPSLLVIALVVGAGIWLHRRRDP